MDLAKTILLPALFDASSPLSGLSKDVIRSILRYFVPNPNGPYLLHKPIARSYYQICSLLIRPTLFRPEMYYLSITEFDARFLSGVPLVDAAERVLRFFLRQKEEGLVFRNYSQERMNELFNDYADFLFNRSANPSSHDCPSLEVQSIWLSHMLQSEAYSGFMQWLDGKYNRKLSIYESRRLCHCTVEQFVPNPQICAPSEKLLAKSIERAFVHQAHTLSMQEARPIVLERILRGFDTSMVCEDQCWLDEFLRFNEGSKVFSREFLTNAHLGYQRMMYLKWNHTEEMERLGFSPCPSIDLIWHTHLLFPDLYRVDMHALLGHVPAHKLLAVDDRTLHKMNCRDDADEALWMKEFQESLFSYSTH